MLRCIRLFSRTFFDGISIASDDGLQRRSRSYNNVYSTRLEPRGQTEVDMDSQGIFTARFNGDTAKVAGGNRPRALHSRGQSAAMSGGINGVNMSTSPTGWSLSNFSVEPKETPGRKGSLVGVPDHIDRLVSHLKAIPGVPQLQPESGQSQGSNWEEEAALKSNQEMSQALHSIQHVDKFRTDSMNATGGFSRKPIPQQLLPLHPPTQGHVVMLKQATSSHNHSTLGKKR